MIDTCNQTSTLSEHTTENDIFKSVICRLDTLGPKFVFSTVQWCSLYTTFWNLVLVCWAINPYFSRYHLLIARATPCAYKILCDNPGVGLWACEGKLKLGQVLDWQFIDSLWAPKDPGSDKRHSTYFVVCFCVQDIRFSTCGCVSSCVSALSHHVCVQFWAGA